MFPLVKIPSWVFPGHVAVSELLHSPPLHSLKVGHSATRIGQKRWKIW